MRNILQEIQENLDKIEARYNVKILLAAEAGSRAWGFASPDSDYDVRFIYMHAPEEYLRVDPMKDVIEWQLDEVLDINGWDLKKAMLAIGKGNPNVMEWANSPIVYRKAPEWDALKSVAVRYFSEKSALCHYYGTANSTYKGFLTGEMIRYKKYFYALRPLLCCHWILRRHEAPPVEFEKLLGMFEEDRRAGNSATERDELPCGDSATERDELPCGDSATERDELPAAQGTLTPELYDAIRELLKRKAITEEKDLNPQMPVIIDFIQAECLRMKQISDAAPDDHRHDFSELNEAFRNCLG